MIQRVMKWGKYSFIHNTTKNAFAIVDTRDIRHTVVDNKAGMPFIKARMLCRNDMMSGLNCELFELCTVYTNHKRYGYVNYDVLVLFTHRDNIFDDLPRQGCISAYESYGWGSEWFSFILFRSALYSSSLDTDMNFIWLGNIATNGVGLPIPPPMVRYLIDLRKAGNFNGLRAAFLDKCLRNIQDGCFND